METKAVAVLECPNGSRSSFLLVESSNGNYHWPEVRVSSSQSDTEQPLLDEQKGDFAQKHLAALASEHRCELSKCASCIVPLYDKDISSAGEPVNLRLQLCHVKGAKRACTSLCKRLSTQEAGKTILMPVEELVRVAWSSRSNVPLRIPFKTGILQFPESLKTDLPFVFNGPCVELELHRFLQTFLQQRVKAQLHVDVCVRTLNPEQAALRVDRNRDAIASIDLLVSEPDSEETHALRWPFPDCIHGVFAFHSEDKKHASRGRLKQPEFWTWRPRLVPKPGVWKIRKLRYSKGKRVEEFFLRLGLANGKYLDVPCDAKRRKAFADAVWKSRAAFGGVIVLPGPEDIDNVYENLKQFISENWPAVFFETPRRIDSAKPRPSPELQKLLELLQTLPEQDGDAPIYDEQDLGYQRLYTYSAFVIDRFERRLIAAFRKSRAQDFVKALPQRMALATRSELLGVGDLDGMSSTDADDKWLQPLKRLNGIEALSQLTSFDRYAPGMARRATPVLRQNHPSFAGYVCPVESPESKRVGITLHLAQGALADVRGNLSRADQETPYSALGYAASLVPFYQHNDGPRSMMGAKNLKQAVPLAGATPPLIKTGSEEQPKRVLGPLIQAGMIPDDASFFSPGVDLLVAYMPWYGWNYEDAIVANERLVRFDKDLENYPFDYGFIEEFSLPIQRGWELCEPCPEDPWHSAWAAVRYANNLLQPGVFVSVDTELAFFEKEGTRGSVRAGVPSGELVSIAYTPPSDLLSGRLDWRIRTRLPLSVGDKLMGRYGNKGVISTFFPPEKMPRLPEDDRLGGLSGKAVDLVLNPHGVVSRMNLGQLLETQLGLLAALGREIPGSETAGKAFQSVDISQIRCEFRKINKKKLPPVIDEHGRMYLTLPGSDATPRRTTCPVAVGIQHVVRLDHAPVTKAAVHSSGKYSLRTGQPTRTSAAGDSPQRLGEMEIWALAAHQATKLLHSTLTLKSSRGTGSAGPVSHVFPAICDHLFALGIIVEESKDKFQLRYATSEDVKSKGKEVSSPRVWRRVNVSGHECSKKCGYKLEEMSASAESQRGRNPHLCIGDVLEHLGLTPGFKMDEVVFQRYGGKTQKKTVRLSFAGSQIKFSLERGCRHIKVSFKIKRTDYVAYAQIASDAEFRKGDILKLRLTCPKHSTTHLQPVRSSRQVRPVPGGLADESIFGRADKGESHSGNWGYIRLPKEFKQPLFPLSKTDECDKVPVSSYIPVLPLRYRYPRPEIDIKGTVTYTEELTRLYEKILRAKDSYLRSADELKRASEPEEKVKWENIKESRATTLREAVFGLRRVLAQQVFAKQGIIRRQGLGRRVDYSGRFVIVPDPGLAWASCGVPFLALYEWLKDKITVPHDLKGHLKQAMASIWATGSVRDLSDQQKNALKDAEKVLKDYLAEHDHIRVLLNRQPSLHRYNVQAFRPEVLPAEKGFVLSINPLVCAGFGADFDGDAMAVHLITDKAECEEANRMLPTAPVNLLSLANAKPVASYAQDMVLGSYILSKTAGAKKLLPVSFAPCDECKRFLSGSNPLDLKAGRLFLTHLCEAHAADVAEVLPHWMNRAFEAATEAGVSYGFLELVGLKVKSLKGVFNKLQKGKLTLATVNQELNEHTLTLLKKALANPANPGYGLAVMALSGARGGGQVRQLLAARGYLDPGDTGFDANPKDFFFETSLCKGMTPEQAFFAATNGRSSMIDKKCGTPKAGYLTRKLVLACWPWHITGEPCDSSESERSIFNCGHARDRAICSACYGTVYGYDDLNGFPAGLIAAQSVGERGTQLSMQSFHSGERAISLDEVDALFEGRYVCPEDRDKPEPEYVNLFKRLGDGAQFLNLMKQQKAYEDIKERHLMLIWRIIHESEKKTLSGASKGQFDVLSGLAGPAQRAFIKQAADDERKERCGSPLASVLRSRPPVVEEKQP